MEEHRLRAESIEMNASALALACDLVDEFRWQNRVDGVVFRERLSVDDRGVRLSSLWLLGWRPEQFVLCALDATQIRDRAMAWHESSFRVTDESLEAVVRRCRGRYALGADAYDAATLLAADHLRV